jgi:hypothetical protein
MFFSEIIFFKVYPNKRLKIGGYYGRKTKIPQWQTICLSGRKQQLYNIRPADKDDAGQIAKVHIDSWRVIYRTHGKNGELFISSL